MSSTSSGQIPAGHDSHLYDPTTHDNQIVAIYETNERARAARDALVAAGVSSGAVQVAERDASMATGTSTSADPGFWDSLKSLFAPEEDVHAYGHAMQHGHAMVVVTPGATADRSHIIDVLEGTDPLDFDAKLEEWRQSGYEYSPNTLRTETATGMATGTGTAMGTVTDNATMDSAPMTDRTSLISQGERAPGMTGAATAAMGADTETIKVMQERLRVGKREVAGGAVRVRSYVVERPVEEQVRLHEERVTIERHPVDRAATAADTAAFQERIIEARATSEEAVISKEARVVEEIGIKKQATDRTETVRDTVRETKVEVEDTTKGTPTGAAASTATPGATSSGMNAPRK